MTKYRAATKATISSLEQIAERHERAVTRAVLEAMMNTVPLKAMKEPDACGRMLAEAERVGKIAAAEMLNGLVESGVLPSLAAVARAHLSGKASKQKRSHRGAERAGWRVRAEAALRKRRNLNASADDLIDMLVNQLVIDRADGGEFECHETGERVATSARNMAAEIARMKRRILESRAGKGM